MYEKVIGNIEKWTKIVYMSTAQVTLVTLFIPNLLASYWFYYTTDRGGEAFKQTVTMS